MLLSVLRGFILLVISFAFGSADEETFVLIGVSGTLQDGFELRDRLDHVDGATHKITRAIFVGTALVRGYKSYLDIKQNGWREYKQHPDKPQVPNPVVIPTGCYQDANVYWLYLVAPEQVLSILAGEPRYLSISPDTGLVDLTATETSENVRQLALRQMEALGHDANQTVCAVPLVTGVWFDADSFVESPIIYIKEDGTRVTSYDQSLALWAGVDRDDLPANDPKAWQTVLQKVRQVEADGTRMSLPRLCHDEARFGVSNNHLRLNYPLGRDDIHGIAGLETSLHNEL